VTNFLHFLVQKLIAFLRKSGFRLLPRTVQSAKEVIRKKERQIMQKIERLYLLLIFRSF